MSDQVAAFCGNVVHKAYRTGTCKNDKKDWNFCEDAWFRKWKENMPSLIGITYDSIKTSMREKFPSLSRSLSTLRRLIPDDRSRESARQGERQFLLTLSGGSGQALDVPPELSELLGQLAAMMKTIAGDDDDCHAIRTHDCRLGFRSVVRKCIGWIQFLNSEQEIPCRAIGLLVIFIYKFAMMLDSTNDYFFFYKDGFLCAEIPSCKNSQSPFKSSLSKFPREDYRRLRNAMFSNEICACEIYTYCNSEM